MNETKLIPETSSAWLGLGQAALSLGVHPTTLRRWSDNGEIPVMLTPGGHRRFAVSDLKQFAEERKQLRVKSGLEQIWADHALLNTRQAIVNGQGEPWLAIFSDAGRQEQRELGRRLMGVMLQYVALRQGGDDLLAEAQMIGRAYAENALGLGLSLVEALQAMLFFRDTLVEAAVQMPEAARVRPEANLKLVRRINQLLNVVHFAVAGTYEQARR
jgi:excisionase family DNA binding protein